MIDSGGSNDLNVLNDLLVIASPFQQSARRFFLAISIRTSVSTNVLFSVATTLELLPQAPCVGPAVADVGPSLPNSTEWGFEKALFVLRASAFFHPFPEQPLQRAPRRHPGRYAAGSSGQTLELQESHRQNCLHGVALQVSWFYLDRVYGITSIDSLTVELEATAGNPRAMCEAAKVLSEASALTPTEQPLSASTPFSSFVKIPGYFS